MLRPRRRLVRNIHDGVLRTHTLSKDTLADRHVFVIMGGGSAETTAEQARNSGELCGVSTA